MVIENFSFNTKQGKTIEFHNKTIEEIANGLQNEFPKWSADTCMKMANNKSFYTIVIPIKKNEKQKKERTSFKTPIIVNGTAINDLLKLGKSICAYHNNGYRQWGVCINEIFDDWKLTPTYNMFELDYLRFVKNLKANALTEDEQKTKVIKLCNDLLAMSKTIKSSRILKEEGEFINGCGRRLGLKELINRAETIGTDILGKM